MLVLKDHGEQLLNTELRPQRHVMLRHLEPLDVLLLALSQVLEELEGALLTDGQQGVN
jgi:hypothetical protein